VAGAASGPGVCGCVGVGRVRPPDVRLDSRGRAAQAPTPGRDVARGRSPPLPPASPLASGLFCSAVRAARGPGGRMWRSRGVADSGPRGARPCV